MDHDGQYGLKEKRVTLWWQDNAIVLMGENLINLQNTENKWKVNHKW